MQTYAKLNRRCLLGGHAPRSQQHARTRTWRRLLDYEQHLQLASGFAPVHVWLPKHCMYLQGFKVWSQPTSMTVWKHACAHTRTGHMIKQAMCKHRHVLQQVEEGARVLSLQAHKCTRMHTYCNKMASECRLARLLIRGNTNVSLHSPLLSSGRPGQI